MSSAATIHDVQRLSHEGAATMAHLHSIKAILYAAGIPVDDAAVARAAQLPPKPTATQFPELNEYELYRECNVWEKNVRLAGLDLLNPPEYLSNPSETVDANHSNHRKPAELPPPSNRVLRKREGPSPTYKEDDSEYERPAKRLKKGKLCHIVVWCHIVVSC